MDKVRIGIIGCGGIARGAHLPGLAECPDCEVTALCDIDPAALAQAAARVSVPPERQFSDYRDLVACPEVDAVEVCTPNNMHVPCAMAAVEAGKPVNVEKPLALSCEDAQPLLDLLEKKPVVSMMCFSYRFLPAVQYARHLMAQELLGDIVSISVEYLKESAFWEGRRLDWRFDKAIAGSGVLSDLGAHLVDMTRFLVGEFTSVSADCGTVVKRRQRLDSDEWADVTTDDYCHFIARVGNGTFANFTITRCAIGQRNSIRYDIYGTKGALSFDLNHPELLQVCVGSVDRECAGMHTVTVPAKYRQRQETTFVRAVQGRADCEVPSLQEGMACQRVLDALLRSAEEHRWVEV